MYKYNSINEYMVQMYKVNYLSQTDMCFNYYVPITTDEQNEKVLQSKC